MKKQSSVIFGVVLPLLAIFSLFSMVGAQEGSVPFRKQARTAPTSNNVVTLRITLPDGQMMKASEREGGLIRIETNGKTYGLTPHIRDKENGVVGLDIFQMNAVIKDKTIRGESIRILEAIEVNRSFTRYTSGDSSFAILVENIQISSDQTNVPTISPMRPVGDDRCCVTCGSTTACACAVVLGCGSCCSGYCCE